MVILRRIPVGLFACLLSVTSCATACAQDGQAAVEHGRLEEAAGLRILRLWGTPEQRGRAHGLLLGEEIAGLIRAEFDWRFRRREAFLGLARDSLDRLIELPESQRAETEALFQGMKESGADLSLPAFDRKIDLKDLLVVQSLDVFGLMGCSGFTAWGEQVEGGGVLSGRNFDWPFSGAHTIDNVVLLVQHEPDGDAVASVTWPGYLGAVTAVDQSGIAVFLHTGSAKAVPMPEPDSYPTATAARAILEQVDAGDEVFGKASELLEWTSPPIGFITRVILPAVPEEGGPVELFEVDARSVARTRLPGPSAVTNHFLGRDDGRDASRDSQDRFEAVQECLQGFLTEDDRKLCPDEAWDTLRRVQRGGGHAFGTLHSLVFRAEPWHFDLRIAEYRKDGGLIAAPDSTRVHLLTRDQVFPLTPR